MAGRAGGVEAAGATGFDPGAADFDPDAAGLKPAVRGGAGDGTVRGGGAAVGRDVGEVFDGRTGGAGAWAPLGAVDNGVDGPPLAHSPSGPAVTIVA